MAGTETGPGTTNGRGGIGRHDTDSSVSRASRNGNSPINAALYGLIATAVALGVSELVAGLVPGAPSLVIAVGSLVIALQPAGAKDIVATLFGTADKVALDVTVIVAALAVGALTGIAARRDVRRAAAVFVAFGALGFVAAVTAGAAPPALALLTTTAATAGGLATFAVLRRAAGDATSTRPAADGARPPAAVISPAAEPGRRRFLLVAGAAVAMAVLGGWLGRLLLELRHPTGAPAAAVALPTPASPAPSPPPGSSFSIAGISPVVTPTADFYRIDTALLVPQVNADSWQLRVTGMIDRPRTWTYADLLAMPLVEQYVTIACVSNPVGGDLVGNARWSGVRLKEILDAVGVTPGATQVVGRSVDGFTVGFPTAWALDPAREPMIALGMNGGPLPAEHGFPARLIVPGLYGYVSATKWLSEIELTTREGFDAYWVPLGWAKDGPILTQSRIDTPRDGDRLQAGRVEIGGVAWAPDRGIRDVEVSIDNGPWQAADLARAISKTTWVQWMLAWDATPGSHTIEVRATDGTGDVQTADRTDPTPDGARGHQRIRFDVA